MTDRNESLSSPQGDARQQARLSEVSLRYILSSDILPEVEGYAASSISDDNSGIDVLFTPNPEAQVNFVVPELAGHVAVEAFVEYVGKINDNESTFSYSFSDETGIDGSEFFLNGLNPDHQDIYRPIINYSFPETSKGTKLTLKGIALFYTSLMLGFAYSEIKDFNDSPDKMMSRLLIGASVLTLPMIIKMYKEITQSKKSEKEFWLLQFTNDSPSSLTDTTSQQSSVFPPLSIPELGPNP